MLNSKRIIDFKEPTKLENALSTIKDWVFPVIRFYRNTARLFAYAPLVWRDRDWDEAYIMEMLLFKLKRTYKELLNDKLHDHDKTTIQSIRVCIKLMSRMTSSDDEKENKRQWYYHNFSAHMSKWPNREFIPIVGSDNFKWEIPDLTDAQREQERHECRIALEIDNRVRQQDEDLFFKIFQKYYQTWWC